MSLENLSLEDLYREIEARKSAAQAETRRELEEARRKVRELEAKLGESQSSSRKAVGLPKPKLSIGERAERIFSALDGRDFTSAQDLASLVGFDGNALRDTLQSLVDEKRVIREGKARGTKYKLA